MKKNILFFAALMMVSVVRAEIYSGICGDYYGMRLDDNLTWTLDTETGILTITGTGDMCNQSEWFEYREYITSVVLPDGLNNIGDEVFGGCVNLTNINIPNSVTSIGDYAFANCGLTSIDIPNSVMGIGWAAFLGCSNLISVSLPDSLVGVGLYAFSGCSSLRSIRLPSTMIAMSVNMFFSCTALESVICEAVVPPTCGKWAFSYMEDNEAFPIPATLYVPCESLSAYQTADTWKDFPQIECINESTIISSVEDERVIPANGLRYNVLGQPVGEDYKGIVIVNGKKYLAK